MLLPGGDYTLYTVYLDQQLLPPSGGYTHYTVYLDQQLLPPSGGYTHHIHSAGRELAHSQLMWAVHCVQNIYCLYIVMFILY